MSESSPAPGNRKGLKGGEGVKIRESTKDRYNEGGDAQLPVLVINGRPCHPHILSPDIFSTLEKC